MRFRDALLIVLELIFGRILLTGSLILGLTFMLYGAILHDTIMIGLGLIISTAAFVDLMVMIRNLPIGYGTIRGSLIEFFKTPNGRTVFGRLIDNQFNETGFFFFESIPDKVFVKSSMFAVTFEIGGING